MKKHKTMEATTFNGTVVNNVAVSRTGVPILGARLGFYTVTQSGRVVDRSIKKDDDSNTQA